MKNIIIVSILFCLVSIQSFATTYTWVGTTSNWTTASNWSPASVPTSADNVTITSTGASPQLQGNVTITNFSMSGNTLDLNGDTLTVNGTLAFGVGTVTSTTGNALLKLRGTTIIFTSGTFDVKIDAVVSTLRFNGSTFNKKGYFEANSTVPGTSNGGSVFLDSVIFYRSNAGSGHWTLANTTGNRYDSYVKFENAGIGSLITTATGGSKFNGNIQVENTYSGINIGSIGGSDTLASGKTITIGSGGFGIGTLLLRNFIQLGSTSQSFTLTSTASLSCINAVFNGAVSFTAPSVLLKESTFNAASDFTVTGSTQISMSGGNIFNGTASFTNNGTNAYWRLALNASNTFNDDATFNGVSAVIRPNRSIFKKNVTLDNYLEILSDDFPLEFQGSAAQSLTGNNSYYWLWGMTINKTSSSVTINKPVRIAEEFVLTKGNLITTSTNLLSLDNGSIMTGGSDSSFVDGPIKKTGNTSFIFPVGKNSRCRPIEISAPSVNTNAYTAEYFDGGQTLGNTMDGTIKYIRDCGYWNLARNSGSSNVTVKLSWDSTTCGLLDSATVKVANWNGTTWKDLGNGGITGNRYTGKVANSSTVVTWGNFALAYNKCFITANAGSDQAICASDSTTIGNSPVATMGMGTYTYSWSPSTALSSTSVANPKASPSTTTNYIVTVTDASGCSVQDTTTVAYNALPTVSAGADQSFCDGGSVTIGDSPTATGGSSPYTYNWSPSTGLSNTTTANPTATPSATTNYFVTVTDVNGCTKRDTVVITDNSITYTWTGATSSDWDVPSNWSPSAVPGYCDNVNLVNSGHVLTLTRDVYINSCIATSCTINGSYGLSMNGKAKFNSISMSSGNLSVFNSDTLSIINSHFDDLYGEANFIMVNQSEFESNVFLVPKGNGDMYWDGGNTFHGTFYVENMGDGNIYMANSYPDTFEGNVALYMYGLGTLNLGYTMNTTFKCANINIIYWHGFPNNGPVSFGMNGGKTIFTGTAEQSISITVSPTHPDTLLLFKKLEINKDSGSLSLELPIVISDSLILKKGNIESSMTNLITMNAGSIVSGASDSSFVDGPLKKIGNTAFIFPTGKENLYRPIAMSAPINTSDSYTAEYFIDSVLVNTSQRDSTLGYVIRDKFWKLNRNNGTSQVYVTLSWNSNCSIQDTNIFVSSWDGSTWKDLGFGLLTGTSDNGSLRSAIAAQNFNEFAISYQLSPASFTCSTGSPTYSNDGTYIKYYTFDASGFNLYPVNLTTYNALTSESPFNLIAPTLPIISTSPLIQNYVHNTDVNYNSQQDGYSLNYTNNIIGIEFAFRLDENFGNKRSIRFFELGEPGTGHNFHVAGGLEYPNLYFITRRDNGPNTTTDDENFEILLDGIGRKSFDYYTDGNWHHMFFKYDAVSGEKEIWVDGQLNDAFQSSVLPGTISNIYPNFKLLPGGDYDKFLGSMDELVIYTNDLCDNQIVQHYLDISGSTPHHYCFNTTCSPIATTVPTGQTLLGQYDNLEYPENYTPCTVAGVNAGSCTPSYSSSSIKTALDQMKTYPLPRYKPNMTLRRNVDMISAFYLGGFKQDGVSDDDAAIEGAVIQEELFKNWNYHYNITETNFGEVSPDRFVELANTSPILGTKGSYAACISRPLIYNSSSFSYLSCPFPTLSRSWVQTTGLQNNCSGGCGNCSESYWGQPQGYYYLNSSSSVFLDPGGNPTSNRYWDYSADTGLYKRDGAVMREHFDNWISTNSGIFSGFKLDFIAENNEIASVVGSSALVSGANQDPDVTNDFQNNSPGAYPEGWSNSLPTGWLEYQGYKKRELDNNYRDEFFQKGGTPTALKNTMFLNYAVDGEEGVRYLYESMRKTQLPINGNYYPTPDFYPRYPSYWRMQSVSYYHGISWVDKARLTELPFGDNKFAPYVAAGWDRVYAEVDIRPAQWLGLMKIVGMMGVDFYHSSHFKDAPSYGTGFYPPNPKGYIWQAATPTYAQAILSRLEDYLNEGGLVAGNFPIDNEPGNHGYILAGDQPNKIAVARKLNGVNKWAIAATIQPVGNVTDGSGNPNAPINSESVFDLNPGSSVLVTLPIRRQGSTYIYDKTNPNQQKLIQLDKWHQYEHPDYWSKDFAFEAEVFDNTNASAEIETEKNIVTPHTYINDGNFLNVISYVTFTTNSGGNALDYYFTPRNDGAVNAYDLWIRARTKTSGKTTGMKLICQTVGNSSFNQENKVSCIASTDWAWYGLEACGGTTTVIQYGSSGTPLTDDQQYKLSLYALNSDLEIDEIYLNVSGSSLPFTPGTQTACIYDYELSVVAGTNTSFLANTAFLGPIPAGSTVNIIGNFTINTSNYTFQDCIINMEYDAANTTDAKITVNSTRTLNLNNCSVSACGDMWDRINNNGTVYINESTIMDAKNGLVNNNGSPFHLYNSTFDKNYYSVKLLTGNFGGFGASTVNGCTFKCSDGQITKNPYAGKQTYRHFYLDAVTDFTLGDISGGGSSLLNHIRNASVGVFINYASGYSGGTSNIGIGTTNFEREVVQYNYTATCQAILDTNKSGGLVGNLDVKYNSFKDWTYGIYPRSISSAYEEYNTFDKVNYGILNSNCGSIDVLTNIFTNCLKPIKCYNNSLSHMEINDNTINYGVPYDKETYSDEGIRIDMTTRPITVPATFFHVKNNKIYNCRIGFHAKYSDGVQFLPNSNGNNEYHTSIPVDELMAYPTSQPHYGVWMESSKEITVKKCHISWDSGDNADVDQIAMMRGISCVSSTKGLLQENSITNMGAGIHIKGNCLNKKLKCNTITDCFNGVYLDPNDISTGHPPTAKLSNQGILNSPSSASISWNDNWDNTNSSNDKIAGTLAPGSFFNWMYNTGGNVLDNPLPFNLPNMTAISCLNTDATCDPPSSLSMSCDEFVQYFYPVINDTISYPSNDSIYIYHKFENYYNTIKDDTTVLYSCTSSGSRYRVVYDSLRITNIGMFAAIQDSIDNGNLSSALANLDTMQTENIMEFNLWYSLREFVNYYSQGDEPDSTAIDSLYNIATQDVFHGGIGVHVAQALLHLDFEEPGALRLAQSDVPKQTNNKQSSSGILFFPNPATNEVSVVFKGIFIDKDRLQIFDMLNQLNVEYPLPAGISIFKFSTASLKPGIYYCRIINEHNLSEKTKLMIIR
jgi:hypothetical protein